MNWINISTAFTIAVALVVFLQGWSILRHRDSTKALRILGVLTILLAVLAILVEILYYSGEITFSFEFLTILVQGVWTEIFFVILLLTLSLFLSFSWHILRLKAGQAPQTKWSLVAAALLWLGAIVSIRQINRGEFDAPPVFTHQTFVLIIYLYLCYILIVFIIPKWTKREPVVGLRTLLQKTIERMTQYRFMPEVLVIMGVGACLMLYDFALPGPALGIVILLAGWAAITEIVTDGALQNLYEAVQNREGFWGNGFPFRRRRSESQNTNSSSPMESKASGWRPFFNLVITFVLLIFFSEALNIGKTIIQSFQAIGFKENTSLADSINQRLINGLAQLNQQLQPETILLTPGDNPIFIRAGDATSTVDAIVANNASIDIGTVKIPVNILVSPIQSISRPIFKVRVVNGSIFSEGSDYVLLATANDGDTWDVRTPKTQLDEAIPNLVERMAFKVLTSEPDLGGYGITSTWEAFQPFQEGMQSVQQYEKQSDFDALDKAIQRFREAIDKDHNFALAYYRLGLALQQNKQPGQAKSALETAILLNPDAAPLKNALAYHLYFYDLNSPYYPAVVSPPQVSKMAQENHRYQARKLWHQIIRLPASQVALADLASAYSGLCRDASDSIQNRDKQRLLAYFYCHRSLTLLERLPSELQSMEIIHQAEAENWNNLGRIVPKRLPSRPLKGWKCMSFDFSKELGDLDRSFYSSYSPVALHYYEKASELLPQDIVIQCNAAIYDSNRMKDLESSPQAHYQLGADYFQKARTSSGVDSSLAYYKEALQEYQTAIEKDAMYHDALNEYAYTYWVFRLRLPDQDPLLLGIPNVQSQAVDYARQAVHMAKLRQDSYLEILYSSTLAEVLLTYGEPQKAQEATQILLPLFENQKVPANYTFDEIRWDLAQAFLCSIGTDQAGSPVNQEEMEAKAEEYLKKIRDNEAVLETRLLSQLGKGWLDRSQRLPFCRH